MATIHGQAFLKDAIEFPNHELVDELNRDAAYAADMRYCSIELDVVHQETGKIWN